MRPFVALVALAIVLAGCAGTKETPTTSGSGTGGSKTTTAGTTGRATTTGHTGSATTSNPSGNKAPTGTIAASVPGGGVPLNVTFTLTATDVDKDPLSFTLDANGDGTADTTQAAPATLPATVHYTYSTPGLFNVTYTISDGKSSTPYHSLVNVTAAGTAATKQYSGHVAGPDPIFVGEGECLFALGNDAFGTPGGVAGDSFQLGGDYTGWTFAFDIDGMVAQFNNADGYVGDAASSGTVAPGATGVYVCSEMAANTDYTLTLTSP